MAVDGIGDHQNVQILVVDDEPLLRLVLVDLFEDAGFLVHEAESAADALTILKDHPAIRVVVTDIQMPGSMDGSGLARYIRDAYPPIALIISSGAVAPNETDLPVDAVFLPKPIDQRELLATVTRLLEGL